MLNNFLLVGFGGFIGAISRYGLGMVVTARFSSTFPIATLMINVLGCFARGILFQVFSKEPMPALQLLIVVGFLGGFTTFSAFGIETIELIKRGHSQMAMAYVASSLLLGFVAVAVGGMIGRLR